MNMRNVSPHGSVQSRGEHLPPLHPEDHACDACALVYSEITIEDALAVIRTLPSKLHDAIRPIPEEARRRRPSQQVWSVTEYVCHLRDVYVTYTIRLHRTRTEDLPQLEPMFNDLRARRFRYNDRDLVATLNELAAATAGLCDEAVCNSRADWDRIATRLPHEKRTARWLLRQAMHEGVHHLGDISTVGRALATLPP